MPGVIYLLGMILACILAAGLVEWAINRSRLTKEVRRTNELLEQLLRASKPSSPSSSPAPSRGGMLGI